MPSFIHSVLSGSPQARLVCAALIAILAFLVSLSILRWRQKANQLPAAQSDHLSDLSVYIRESAAWIADDVPQVPTHNLIQKEDRRA